MIYTPIDNRDHRLADVLDAVRVLLRHYRRLVGAIVMYPWKRG